ncbi:lipoxygenase family protein [Microcoleus sp. OTE_8_concoct_300]|uniref:lipoxygenase family protein n=1 Tax=Microcoleus sp. OTE_8_concoct_300 TaxID=2964710 RepID=UPI00403FB217
MHLSSEAEKFPSDKNTLINTLLTLYKFVKFAFIFFPGQYNYNYDYIRSLAMTTSPPLPLINLNIPSQELPNIKWVTLVIQQITLLNANKARHFDNGIASFSVRSSTEENSGVDHHIEVLKNTEQEIEAADSKGDLKDIAWKIASAAKHITQELSPEGVSFSVRGSESVESSAMDEQLREIDEQYAQAYQSSKPSEALDFNRGSDLEDRSGESFDLAFQEIIKENIRLLDLESEESSNLDFSTARFQDFASLESYNSLFVDIPLPQISKRFQEDLIFAYMRVAGPNPLMLQQLSERDQPLQVTNEKYQQIIERFKFADSLEAALQEGRLYKADYSMLKNMAQGSFPHNVKKYPGAPLALFAVPPVNSSSRSLIPVAIQCQQPSVSENPPVFTPLDGDNWMVAKTIVNMADSNYHELVSHLGRTHLFVEPFVLATKRKLPANHKLRILLEPHFEGTILINYGAHKSLIAPGGQVDKLLASTIEDDQVLAIEGAKSYLHSFNDVMFPKTLTSHGVSDSDQLPEYPYRDDGLLIWDAIKTWVSAYLSIYYTSDQQLLKDKDLQNWAQELVSDQGGRLKNFGEDDLGGIKTLGYLIDAVSSVIFTASAQHAAVNFPQSELMSYAPAFPLALYSPAPTSSEEQGNFMSMLPSVDRAQTQIEVLGLLGSVYYTKLGQYNKGHFKDAKVMSYLGQFQNQLRDIEVEISKKNFSRLMPYKFLLPSQIPQSINI